MFDLCPDLLFSALEGLFLFSGGYLYWLIRESGTASFWTDYEFHPWEKERA